MYCGICGLISRPSSSTAAGAVPAYIVKTKEIISRNKDVKLSSKYPELV